MRIYLATPRLHWLLSLNLAAAAAGAMVLVNTVVLVRSDMGLAIRRWPSPLVLSVVGQCWRHSCSPNF
jgi:hypothetical protein